MPRSHRFPTRRTLPRVSHKLYPLELISTFFPRRRHFRFRYRHEHDINSRRRVPGESFERVVRFFGFFYFYFVLYLLLLEECDGNIASDSVLPRHRRHKTSSRRRRSQTRRAKQRAFSSFFKNAPKSGGVCVCGGRQHPRFFYALRRHRHHPSSSPHPLVFVLSLLSFNDERERKKEKKLRDRIFYLGCTSLTEPKPLFSLLFSLFFWGSVFWINFRQNLARTLTTLASIITMSGVGILTISTRTTSFSRCVSSSSASACCVNTTNKTVSLRSFKNSSSSSWREQRRGKFRKGDEEDDDVGVHNEKRNRVRTRAMFGGDAMMMPPPASGGGVSTNNAPEIERVEMLKQRNRSNVFDIADASSLSLAAPPAVLMSETPPEIETVAPNLMEEDSLNIATAPDVVVQSSIKDAMALIQAEEREAKIASGEIVGTLFRLFSFPFVAFFFLFSLAFVFLRLLHRRSTVIWAIHSVPLSQHFYCAATSTLGPRARRLTIGYLFRWIGVRRNV